MTANAGFEFRIRPAGRRDIPAVDALLSRSYPRLLKADYPPSVLVTAIPLISRAQPALVTCGTYYVAETEIGVVVGVGGWTPGDPISGRRRPAQAHIRHFGADPDHTRRGIAGALMAHCITQAQAAGIRTMFSNSTLSAVPFYESQGFTDPVPIEIELRPGIRFPSVRLRREIG